jgi:hypothetical protein
VKKIDSLPKEKGLSGEGTRRHLLLSAVRYSALAVCAICILGILAFFCRLPTAMDPQGGESDGCINEELPAVSNGAGMVATGHETWCDDVFVHDGATYIYVHRSGKGESRKSLVFRFGNSVDYGVQYEPPRLEWGDKSTLHISVGTVEDVTKQVNFIDGVRISYSIGKEEYLREDWDRSLEQLKHIAEGMLVALVALTCVCVILVRSIINARRG